MEHPTNFPLAKDVVKNYNTFTILLFSQFYCYWLFNKTYNKSFEHPASHLHCYVQLGLLFGLDLNSFAGLPPDTAC